MTMAYNAAMQAGNNISRGFREARDTNTIDEILSNALKTDNPQALQSSIVKILSQVSPEKQGAAIQFLQSRVKSIDESRKEKLKVESGSRGGYDPYATPGVQTQQVKDKGKRERLGNIFGQPQPMNQMAPMNQGFSQEIANSDQVSEQQSPFSRFTKGQLIGMAGSEDREISEPAKAELRERDKQDILKHKEEQAARKEIIEFHKESAKYDDELQHNARVAKKQDMAIDDIEKAINSGNIKPSSWANIFKGFGALGEKISNALINKNEAELSAAIPQLLEGWKQVFGVRLTDADLQLLQDKLPSIGKTPEANRAVLGILRKYSEASKLRAKIGAEIKKANKGLRPLGYADQIEERYDEMTKPVRIKNPNSGRVVEIPAYQVSDAINNGGVVVDE